MKLTQHVPLSVMEFERFEDYYYQPKNGLPEDRRVRFKLLNLKLVPEEATRVAAIRAGEADISPIGLTSKQQVTSGGSRVVFGPQGVYIQVMIWGCHSPQYPCYKKGVRQALDYAIDKKLMADKLFGGPEVFEVKGWSATMPSVLGYSADLEPFPQDVAKARQLLADAGYPNGKGFGKLLVNTWVSPVNPFLPDSAQLAADFWRKELGLEVEVKVGDEVSLKRDMTSGSLYGTILWRDGDAAFDKTSHFRGRYGTPGSVSRLHDNPEIFELVQKALNSAEPAERHLAFNAMNKRLRDEGYEIGIGHMNVPWAVGPRVLTWQPWPLAYHPTNLHGITLK